MRLLIFLGLSALICPSMVWGEEAACQVSHFPAGKSDYWRKSETPNFVIHSTSDQAARADVALACERQRAELIGTWFSKPLDTWAVKCHVVLHRTKSSYQQAVGSAVANTNGSTWIQFDKQDAAKITLRRIDLLCDQAAHDLSALPHELTHALLADWFGGKQPPRWIDEGLAVLADSAEKQGRHLRDLRQAYYQRTSFRVVELFRVEGHPRADRIPAFYGQSLALVKLLVERDTPDKLLLFVDRSHEVGYDAALREIYKIDGVAELEQLWKTHYDALAHAK
ncbi:MAG TPA: hypothetical protein VL096_19225 [Pirellulaceae bacterium]|nr:hypothetical protein [Pirellulaceae bacterium]